MGIPDRPAAPPAAPSSAADFYCSLPLIMCCSALGVSAAVMVTQPIQSLKTLWAGAGVGAAVALVIALLLWRASASKVSGSGSSSCSVWCRKQLPVGD